MKIVIFAFAMLVSVQSHALINGTPLAGKQDLVKLTFTNGWVCTGVYIDPETILTAAHCISGTSQPKLVEISTAENVLIGAHAIDLIPHPEFDGKSDWHSHDIGIIKTSVNPSFSGDFRLNEKEISVMGQAGLYGCGKIDEKNRARSSGENRFFRIGSIIFILGALEAHFPGTSTSIAPNDSGAPIVNKNTGEIIAIAATSTYLRSLKMKLPILSTGTVLESSNLTFIRSKMRNADKVK